jgi:hypothetical protein
VLIVIFGEIEMVKYQIWDIKKEKVVGEPFEAKNKVEALSDTLAKAHLSVKKVEDDRPHVIVFSSGGVIQNITIPQELGIVVETRDSDVEKEDEEAGEFLVDDDGEKYVVDYWE